MLELDFLISVLLHNENGRKWHKRENKLYLRYYFLRYCPLFDLNPVSVC